MPDPMTSLQSTIPAFNVISPVGAPIVESATGNYRGEAVRTSSESSKLSDAAEELGMSLAHRADKKTLGQRAVRQGQAANLEALARIAEYYDKLPDMPQEDELRALVQLMDGFQQRLGGGGGDRGPTKEDILAALHGFDRDVTHQFAALEIARGYFETAGAPPEFQALLDQAKAEFERADIARDVRAGFAAAEIASREAVSLGTDPAALRDSYRAMLRETMNYGQLFGALAKYDVMKSLGEVVDAFMTVAARDLASTGPSTDEVFLHGLLTELGKLKRLQTTLDQACDLVRVVSRAVAPRDREGIEATGLAGRMLDFAAKAVVSLADARQLLGPAQGASFASQLVLANGLRGLHGELPDEIMPSPQARLQQAATILLLLDDLTTAEQDEFEHKTAFAKVGGGKP